jgi:hypothetical protein
MALFRSITVAEWVYVRDDMSNGLQILSLGVIIMESRSSRNYFRMIDYWFPDDFMRDTHTIPVETDHVFYA